MFNIRYMKKDEIDEICALVCKLSRYVGYKPNLKIDVNEFQKYLKKANAKVLVCAMDNEIIGYAIYYINFCAFLAEAGMFLDNIYVKDEYRGCGIGKKIFEKLSKICIKNDLKSIEWICRKENKPALNFYKSLGGNLLNEHERLKLDYSTILRFSNGN